jgi:ABC-2 type transport system permease protein
VQAALTRTARTDLPAYLAYLDSVAAYHEGLKRRFFPVVFSTQAIRDVAWDRVPRHDYVDEGTVSDMRGAAALLAAWCAAAILVVGLRRRHLAAP